MEGYQNNNYFHSIEMEKEKKLLRGLNIEGRWEENPMVVKEDVTNFFEKKFSDIEGPRPTFDDVMFN